jgi:CHAT domain-containing protein
MGRFTVVLPSSAEPVTAESVRSSLPSDGVLLHYTVAPRWIAVLAFDRSSLRSWAVRDVDESDLADMVSRFTRWASDPAVGERDDSGRRLTQILLEPVKAALAEYVDLVIVPDDVLFGIPWAALPWEEHYLIEGRNLSVEPSASVFVRLTERERRSGDTTALLVANPTIEQRITDESLPPDLETVGSPNVRPLPEAEVEAMEIAGLLPRSEVLLREEADEAEVRSSMGRYGVVHFGTHVWIVNDQPLSSCLLLAGGAKAVEEARLAPVAPSDGVLTGYEALGITLKPGAMVTLAACESVGRGSRRGEGIVGLARAFFEAGAGTVVGSLWAVEDRATRQLMVRFYREISAGGRSTSEALSRAQAAISQGASGERRRHPFYWAGFILIGDGR